MYDDHDMKVDGDDFNDIFMLICIFNIFKTVFTFFNAKECLLTFKSFCGFPNKEHPIETNKKDVLKSRNLI